MVLCSLVLALTACVATQGREVPRRPREINAAAAAPLAAGGGGRGGGSSGLSLADGGGGVGGRGGRGLGAPLADGGGGVGGRGGRGLGAPLADGGGGVGGRGGRGLGAPLADGGGGGVGGRGGRGLGAERETLAGRRRSSRGGSSYYQPSGYYYRPDSAASQRHEYYVPDPAYADGSRYGYYGPGAGKVADPRGDAGRPYAYGYPQYSPEHMPIAEQHGRPKAYFDPMDEDNADVNSMDEGPGDDKGEGRPYNPNPYGVDSYYYKEQVVKSDDYTPDGSEPNRDDDSDDEDEKGEVSKQESPSEHGAGEASEQEEELAALEAEAARKPHRYGEVPLADRRLNPAASQQIDPGVEIVFGLSDGREVKSGALPLDLGEFCSALQ